VTIQYPAKCPINSLIRFSAGCDWSSGSESPTSQYCLFSRSGQAWDRPDEFNSQRYRRAPRSGL